jgi:hypothetical protein
VKRMTNITPQQANNWLGTGSAVYHLIIGVPILAIILAFIGVFSFALFVSTAVDLYLIGFCFILVFLAKRIAVWNGRWVKIPVVEMGIIVGLIYWLITAYIASKTTYATVCGIPLIGQLVCGVGTLLTLPVLIADILAAILWIAIAKGIFKRLL